MSKIPKALLAEILADPFYKFCARKNKDCDGRITFEHVLIFASRQINERWNILPLCEFHHAVNKHQDGGDLNKNINKWIALNRATPEELTRYSKAIDYRLQLAALNNMFGKWRE